MTASEELDDLPRSTAWHRRHGRASRKTQAAKQQYLSPHEEKALAEYVLRMARSGHPLPVKSLRVLAQRIRRQRDSTFQMALDNDVPPPGKNWPSDFYKRHPELKARRMRAIDRNRHERAIYDKVVEWFDVISQELENPDVSQENVYNMDETNVLLSVLGSLKVLVGSKDTQTGRPSCVQRTSVTAVECISADGRYLDPLIIWPAAVHRSTWTVHPTPGWHFARSKTGYTDTAISLYWVQHVFDPLTKARANGKPRVLINDGFGTHESLEVLTFCFQNNIILCRLPSHTSHKLQPCDVGIFGPLKTAYRDQVERLLRGGANNIGKKHFTLLYSKARQAAFTSRNIRASWAKAGLFPFNPERVLRDMQKPDRVQQTEVAHAAVIARASPVSSVFLRTPTTFTDFNDLRCKVESSLDDTLDVRAKLQLQKLWHAAEKVYADRAVLFDENKLLFEQNNEKTVRDTTRVMNLGKAKVMCHQDLLDAQRKRDEKKSRKRVSKRTADVFVVPTAQMLSAADQEMMEARQEVADMGLTGFCHVLDLARDVHSSS